MTLSASQIRFSYGSGPCAVDGVTLEALGGELLGVIGPNGSGKSTVLRLLAGALRPDVGTVQIDSQPLNGLRPINSQPIDSLRPLELARRVAFLPQTVRPAFAFTSEEVVAQGRYPHLGSLGFLSARDIKVVHRAMRETDTEAFANRLIGDLSGGERQRVMIASVLAQEADHLLLDEPTSALDINHQAKIFQLLEAISRRGTAVVAVVHDLNLAAQYCHRLALMSAGRIVAEGKAREVLTPKNLGPVYGGNIAVGENLMSKSPLVTVLTD